MTPDEARTRKALIEVLDGGQAYEEAHQEEDALAWDFILWAADPDNADKVAAVAEVILASGDLGVRRERWFA